MSARKQTQIMPGPIQPLGTSPHLTDEATEVSGVKEFVHSIR